MIRGHFHCSTKPIPWQMPYMLISKSKQTIKILWFTMTNFFLRNFFYIATGERFLYFSSFYFFSPYLCWKWSLLVWNFIDGILWKALKTDKWKLILKMFRSKQSTIIEDCDDCSPKRSTVAIPRHSQPEGQSSRWSWDSREQANAEGY